MRDVIRQIEQVVNSRHPQKRGNEIRFLCPAHDDHNPSARWNIEKHLWCCDVCGVGGGWKDLANRLGIDTPKKVCTTARRAKKSRNNSQIGHDDARTQGCTLEQYASQKKLPIDFLQNLGLVNTKRSGSTAIRIPYIDESGSTKATRYRIALNEKDRFRWKSGNKPILYGLWRLKEMQEAGYIVLVEGESDCHTLWCHNIPAIGLAGAKTWKEEWASYFDGFDKIYVFLEPDTGGEAVLNWLNKSRLRKKTILVRPDGFKDASELHIMDKKNFSSKFKKAIEDGISWLDYEKNIQDEILKTEYAKCAGLTENINILDEFEKDLRNSGYVGCTRNAKIIFLAVTSRFLKKIVSVVVKGLSSSGKSYLVEQVLKFFPESAYYALSSMSSRALIYSEEPLQHRFLVFYEAAGITDETAQYILRSLLSEGHIRYETVESTKDGCKPRLIERDGPTGVILTTTSIHLHRENETRLLSLSVSDTSEQTSSIFRSIAEEEKRDTPDYGKWHSLNRLLEASVHNVTIPYASHLADLVPPIAVRLRRDFSHVLNLIRSHAILHQFSRVKDERGRIIATIDDYAVVRKLLADIVSEGIEISVPETVTETVEAVDKLAIGDKEVTIRQLADELELDTSAVRRRAYNAISLGYIKNKEERRNRPMRLVMGEDLPSAREILPSVDKLQEVVQSCRGLEEANDTLSNEYFEERAAIMEFEGGLSRLEAEQSALRLVTM